MGNRLLLSIFPGIDLLGMGFEEQNFCVVRGPDKITGGDICTFNPPAGVFDGVIGGPPCQDFSQLNRMPGRYGYQMLDEYCRVVGEAGAAWFLFENVAAAPSFNIPGYSQQRFELDLGWFTDYSRNRHFVFGSRSGKLINPIKGRKRETIEGTAVTGSDGRGFRACCDIQGLPPGFDVPFFSLEGKKQAVANGVPLALSRYLAGLISKTMYPDSQLIDPGIEDDCRKCACGCGRPVAGRALTASAACRKRKQRQLA